MIDPKEVEPIVQAAVAEEEAFLVECTVGGDSRITVLADHMEGMSVERLTRISRKIEEGLDREVNDFELEVSSPGVGQPLKLYQQYLKNVGRDVKVILKDGETLKGKMSRATETEIDVEWKERVPKPVGKGKVTVTKKETVALEEIKETRLEIKF